MFVITNNKEGKIRDIPYNWKMADRIEVEVSLKNWPKLTENTPGCQHTLSYRHFQDITLQFTSGVFRNMVFLTFFSLFSTDLNEELGVLNKTKNDHSKY